MRKKHVNAFGAHYLYVLCGWIEHAAAAELHRAERRLVAAASVPREHVAPQQHKRFLLLLVEEVPVLLNAVALRHAATGNQNCSRNGGRPVGRFARLKRK